VLATTICTMIAKNTEEKKVGDAVDTVSPEESSTALGNDAKNDRTSLDVPDQTAEDAYSVLETLDSCVECVEGIDQQHDFEDGLNNLELVDRGMIPSYQTLSDAEASLIRLQIMEKHSETTATRQAETLATIGSLPDLDLLNICGGDDDINDARPTSVVPSAYPTPAAGAKENSEDSTGSYPREVMINHACATSPTSSDHGSNFLQCAICFDEATASSKRITFAKFPCCGHSGTEETTTVKICTACVLVLTSPTSDGTSRIGRCPRCRVWIVVKTPQSTDDFELEITAVAAVGQCLVCNQVKEHLVEDESVCDACFIGRRHPFLYECQQCHVNQRIPHPMYRYQDKPDQFGNVTWACQGRCGKFTNWRIRPDQLPLVPVGDAPDAWGEDFMETARIRVQEARRELSGNNANADENSTGCSIL
jgi:hypothetical protein